MTSPAHLLAARQKERLVADWLRAHAPVLIGFSGGVDSSYLACLAVETLGSADVLAVIGQSASYPAEQWAMARAVADRYQVPVLEVKTDELHDSRYAENPTNRCYFCKSELWGRLGPIAAARGIETVIDGTNADDLTDYRPGASAAREHGVQSPLALFHVTKAEVRLLSRERGLPTWDQPSSPCLASRLPYGTAVTSERLRQVETAERALRALGVVGDMRVRHYGSLALLELSVPETSRWLAPDAWRAARDAVRSAGFTHVSIDLRGFRSGSLNVLAGVGWDAPAAYTGSAS